MKFLLHLVNGLAVVKNQAQTQVMGHSRDSPPALTWGFHHPTYDLWLKVWKAM